MPSLISTAFTLERLPCELIETILDLVLPEDKCNMCCVNQNWYVMTRPRLYNTPQIKTAKQLEQLGNARPSSQHLILQLDLSSVRENATDAHMTKLEHCDQLKSINLSNCSSLSPAIIECLIQRALQSISIVILADCRLSTSVLSALGCATSFQLRTLDLSNTMIRPCIAIDQPNHLESITQWADSSQLLELNLSYCRWVDGETLRNLQRLLCLQNLSLQWCQQLNFNHILNLVQALQWLQQVDLRHVTAVDTPDAALPLLTCAPRLVSILFTYRLKSSNLLRSQVTQNITPAKGPFDPAQNALGQSHMNFVLI